MSDETFHIESLNLRAWMKKADGGLPVGIIKSAKIKRGRRLTTYLYLFSFKVIPSLFVRHGSFALQRLLLFFSRILLSHTRVLGSLLSTHEYLGLLFVSLILDVGPLASPCPLDVSFPPEH
jgi:hypothetical protein